MLRLRAISFNSATLTTMFSRQPQLVRLIGDGHLQDVDARPRCDGNSRRPEHPDLWVE